MSVRVISNTNQNKKQTYTKKSITKLSTTPPKTSVAGFISLDEFAEACELLKKHLPEHDTKEQLLDMCKMMDINKDGLVDLNEFLETFRLCEQTKGNYCKPDLQTLSGANGRQKTAGRAPRAGNGVQKQSTEEDDEEMLLLDCDGGETTTTTMTTKAAVTNGRQANGGAANV